jgi:Spy/CpxP family protein refolding chaperone
MSYGVQSASLFGSTSPTASSSSTSLRPFANLNLTEDQRTQIRSIFQSAKTQGLSQSEVQEQINAILTPAQQTTLQSTLAAQAGAATGSTQASPSGGNLFTNPNGPFANLNLTSDQQSQISQIIKDGKSQGLTHDQINAQISSILTTAQQATFATDVQNLPAGPGRQNSSSATSDPLSNLGLTSDQKTKIDTILQNAQNNGTSQSDVLAQIDGVLTPTQQSAFLQDVQTAQANVSGQSQSGSGGTSSTSTTILANGLTETDIQNQIAAGTSLLLQQFQSEVGGSI